MSRYPIDAAKLLAAAELLAPATPGRGRPSYTAHRRAVSTAYYAVFHAISARVAADVFPRADEGFRQQIRRWIGHGDVRVVSRWLGQVQGTLPGAAPPHIRALLVVGGVSAVDAETELIADGFRELNERREEADYDHTATFRRGDTRGLLALATRTVEVVERVDSGSAERFFGLIALQASIKAR